MENREGGRERESERERAMFGVFFMYICGDLPTNEAAFEFVPQLKNSSKTAHSEFN